jgi:hypothetical protein
VPTPALLLLLHTDMLRSRKFVREQYTATGQRGYFLR